MNCTIENLYAFVGRDDRVAVIDFKEGSESHSEYGPGVAVVFIYAPSERKELEEKFKTNTLGDTHGKIKAKYLSSRPELAKEKREALKTVGFNSNDIKNLHIGWANENLYHEEKTRKITKMEIPIRREPKGGDFDWMYGMKKRFVSKGIGLHPHEREWYLAMKKFYDEGDLTPAEIAEMTEQGALKPDIEFKYLEIKLEKEVISEEEEKKYKVLLRQYAEKNVEVLKEEINDIGLSWKKFILEHNALFKFLLKGTTQYIPERMNVMGKKAIFMDYRSFLHVYLRHVKEFEAGEQVKGKTKFLWTPSDVSMVIKNVIGEIDTEIQAFWEANPNTRFSKYGDHSLYFQGDYYTFHIEADGRLSTFHKSNKKS